MTEQAFVRSNGKSLRAFRWFAMGGLYSYEYRRAPLPDCMELAYVADTVSFQSVTYKRGEVASAKEGQAALARWRQMCEKAGFINEVSY